MNTPQAARTTTTFKASSSAARMGFMSLAAIVTFTVLTSLGGVANLQVEDVLMAQAHSATVVARTQGQPAV
jgi:hypothetical protein